MTSSQPTNLISNKSMMWLDKSLSNKRMIRKPRYGMRSCNTNFLLTNSLHFYISLLFYPFDIVVVFYLKVEIKNLKTIDHNGVPVLDCRGLLSRQWTVVLRHMFHEVKWFDVYFGLWSYVIRYVIRLQFVEIKNLKTNF